jgi:hypothetical protein
MTNVSRDAVWKRARDRCEYCHLRQVDAPFVRHQIEHIIPHQHGGGDQLGNLALACYRCNKFKGPNLSAFDPRTGKVVRLFNPRRQRWHDHFSVRGILILGHTAVGRATVDLLQMNSAKRQALRREID